MTFSVYSSGYPLKGVPSGNVWGVDITGAAPNALVSIHQHIPSGQDNAFTMGATDAQGNYTMRYLLGQNQVGLWHSYWTVGDDKVGEYDFLVLPNGGPDSGYQIVDPQVLKAIADEGTPGQLTGAAKQPDTVPLVPEAAKVLTVPRSDGGRSVRPLFVGVGVIAAGAAGGPIGIAVGVAVTIASILGGLFGGLFGGSGVSRDQIDALRQTIVDIGNTLTAAITAVMHTLGKILKFLKAIWTDVIHPLIDQIRKVLDRLKDLYEKVLKPALDWLHKLRDTILHIYESFLRPIIIWMQRIHQILTILKLFHIKWAAKLDTQLMSLESKLMAPMFWLLHQLNQVANMLNLVFDAGLYLRRAVMLGSMIKHVDGWVPAFWIAQSNPLSGADLAGRQARYVPPTDAQLNSSMQAFLTSGSGPLAGQADAGLERLRQLSG